MKNDHPELIALRQYYENMLALMPGHVYWKDQNSILQGCNNALAHALGLSSREDIIGKSDDDIVPESSEAMALRQRDLKVLISRQPHTDEETFTFPDGRKATYLTQRTPLFDSDNQLIGLIGISLDITIQKQYEELRREKEQALFTQNLETIKTLSASLAHEIRTPLGAINLAASSLAEYLPILIDAYEKAREQQLPVTAIPNIALKTLPRITDDIQAETHAANTIINMMIVKSQHSDIETAHAEPCSISHCIDEALRRYPFVGNQRSLVRWFSEIDFIFHGNELLIVHVLFNLLKNAIYYVKAAGKGDIQIWLEKGSDMNKLYFKDTGAGIAAEILPKIFDGFFSATRHGSGVGLSYCRLVMRAIGGDITCESVAGEHALFVLSFKKGD